MAHTLVSPKTWEEVLAHVGQSTIARISYKAPMDFSARTIGAKLSSNGRIRCFPNSSDADPFFADAGHLDRIQIWVKAVRNV